MQEFLGRLMYEQTDLRINIIKLKEFVNNEKPKDFNFGLLPIMKKQLEAMEKYNECLEQRIKILIK